MTVEEQTTDLEEMEIGTRAEVGIGTNKRRKEEHWTIFGEEEQEQLAMLDGGINMIKMNEVGAIVDMAMRVDMVEEEVVDMVVGVEEVMVMEGLEETMLDMEETMMDTVKIIEAMAETTEDMVEMIKDMVDVAMMEDMGVAVEVTEETMGATAATLGVMEGTLEDLAMVVLDMVDKVHMGEAWVAPEVEEWVVQGVVAGQERERGVRKQWVQWVQRG